MGRKKIEIERIVDERIRRVTFKKRRIGLLKKAIQLSKLTEAKVMLKVYHEEDDSLIEYYSHTEQDFDHLNKQSSDVQLYSKFFNKHYKLVARLDEKVTRHGHPTNMLDENDLEFGNDFEGELDGINMIQLFSLAKRNPGPKLKPDFKPLD
jgi:hypothetical protein